MSLPGIRELSKLSYFMYM